MWLWRVIAMAGVAQVVGLVILANATLFSASLSTGIIIGIAGSPLGGAYVRW